MAIGGRGLKTRKHCSWCVALAAIVLYGCGGGGSSQPGLNSRDSSSGDPGGGPTSGNSGIEGSGIHTKVAYGRIASIADGKLTVSEQVWDVTHAAILIQGSPGSISNLAPGQLVGVTGQSDGTATEVAYAPTIVGSLQNVTLQPGSSTSALLLVLNQQIEVTPNTQFASGLARETLGVGDRLEISAIDHLDANEWLEATYVARAPTAAAPELTGIALLVDAAARKFDIEQLSVSYQNATLTGFPTGNVANGNLVHVVGQADGGGAWISSLVATQVESLQPIPLGVAGDTVSICGVITRFVSSESFDIEGVPTTTGPSTLITPFPGALELNAWACVSGTISALGSVLAQSVSIDQSGDNIGGNITAIDNAANTIALLGTTVALGAATKIEDARQDPVNRPRLALTDLAIGDYVRVAVSTPNLVGSNDPTQPTALSATRIERTVDPQQAFVFGYITGISRSGALQYFNVQMQLSPSTKILTPGITYNGAPLYKCGDIANPCTESEFMAGLRIFETNVIYVQVKGTFENGALEATVADFIAN